MVDQKIIDKFLEWKKEKVKALPIGIFGSRAIVQLFYYVEEASSLVDDKGRKLTSANSQLFPKAKILALGTLTGDYSKLKVGDVVNIKDDFITTRPNQDYAEWRAQCQEDPQHAKDYPAPPKYTFSPHMVSKIYQVDKFEDDVKPENRYTFLLDQTSFLTQDK